MALYLTLVARRSCLSCQRYLKLHELSRQNLPIIGFNQELVPASEAVLSLRDILLWEVEGEGLGGREVVDYNHLVCCLEGFNHGEVDLLDGEEYLGSEIAHKGSLAGDLLRELDGLRNGLNLPDTSPSHLDLHPLGLDFVCVVHMDDYLESVLFDLEGFEPAVDEILLKIGQGSRGVHDPEHLLELPNLVLDHCGVGYLGRPHILQLDRELKRCYHPYWGIWKDVSLLLNHKETLLGT